MLLVLHHSKVKTRRNDTSSRWYCCSNADFRLQCSRIGYVFYALLLFIAVWIKVVNLPWLPADSKTVIKPHPEKMSKTNKFISKCVPLKVGPRFRFNVVKILSFRWKKRKQQES